MSNLSICSWSKTAKIQKLFFEFVREASWPPFTSEIGARFSNENWIIGKRPADLYPKPDLGVVNCAILRNRFDCHRLTNQSNQKSPEHDIIEFLITYSEREKQAYRGGEFELWKLATIDLVSPADRMRFCPAKTTTRERRQSSGV